MLEEDFSALNISRDDDSLYSFKNKMAIILDNNAARKNEAEQVRTYVKVRSYSYISSI